MYKQHKRKEWIMLLTRKDFVCPLFVLTCAYPCLLTPPPLTMQHKRKERILSVQLSQNLAHSLLALTCAHPCRLNSWHVLCLR